MKKSILTLAIVGILSGCGGGGSQPHPYLPLVAISQMATL